VKFLVDAQLPRQLARQLTAAGHDAIHTLDLPRGNRTSDDEIAGLADRDGRVLVTKDSDFVASFWLTGSPSRLLLVSTGNITNAQLLRLFDANVTALTAGLAGNCFLELGCESLIVHA
jgi:predicted nuclease of predicted toxin-antitoxin system